MAQFQSQKDCLDACQRCGELCLQTAMTHCLEVGGQHVQPEHFRLMINCAELCQTTANFILSQSSLHGAVCAACAEVCTACADSCEQIGDMDECVRACRTCANQCEAMGAMVPHVQQRPHTRPQPRM